MLLHKERNISLFLIAIVCISGLGWFINSYSPGTAWTYVIFYLFVGTSTAFLLEFIFANRTQSILGSLGIVGILVLRFFGLRHPLYIVLLAACLISIDIMLRKTKKS